jgi:hypothetical protein
MDRDMKCVSTGIFFDVGDESLYLSKELFAFFRNVLEQPLPPKNFKQLPCTPKLTPFAHHFRISKAGIVNRHANEEEVSNYLQEIREFLEVWQLFEESPEALAALNYVLKNIVCLSLLKLRLLKKGYTIGSSPERPLIIFLFCHQDPFNPLCAEANFFLRNIYSSSEEAEFPTSYFQYFEEKSTYHKFSYLNGFNEVCSRPHKSRSEFFIIKGIS